MTKRKKPAKRISVAELPAHSERGPSSAERWLYRPDPLNPLTMHGCPGSVAMSRHLPDTETVFAAEGTAAHWVSEICREYEMPASELLGYSDDKMPHPDGGFFTCNQEMVDGIQTFLDYVNSIPSDVQYFEPKLTYFQWVDSDESWVEGYGFGTADDIRIDDDTGICYITDLKYGKGIQVFAKENTQLKMYALGVIECYGDQHDINEFRLAISQPRLDHVDEWSISTKELLEWGEDVVKPGAAMTLREDAPIQPGNWCRFCRARDRCRPRAQFILDQVDDARIDLLTNSEIATLLPHIPAIKKWCSEIEAFALSEVSKGGHVGGYYLAEGRSVRSWTDEAALIKAARSRGIRAGDLYEPRKIKSPAQLEKLIGKNHSVMKQFQVKPKGKPVLVPPTDRRPVYEEVGASEFDEFDDFDDIGSKTDDLLDFESEGSGEDDLLSIY